jgi:uncharacterized protein YjiS (DUF1127 family)
MSTMNFTVPALRARHALRWGHLKQHVAEWRHRARSGHELMNLSDRQLRDIGLSRCDAGFKLSKPLWLP